MKIVIPTFMREDWQNCFQRLPDSIKKNTLLFTHSGRAPLLRKHNPTANVYDMGKCDGIADVRQNVIDHCELMGLEKVFMMDDQCYFNVRGSDMKLRTIESEKTFHEMVDKVEGFLDTYPQVGISPRPGNNRVEEDFRTACRSYSCYGLNIKTMSENGLCFDGMYKKDKNIKLFEDFYFTLSMLVKGIPNAVLYGYAHYHNHGRPGGNSHYRNSQTQLLCLEALRDEFPDFVKIVQRSSKTWVFKEHKEHAEKQLRWECTVQWKKAYEYGCQNLLL